MFELARIMGTSVRMIERHYGALLDGAGASIAGRLDAFAKIPHHPFPGGRWLRTPILVAAMAWFKLRDKLW